MPERTYRRTVFVKRKVGIVFGIIAFKAQKARKTGREHEFAKQTR